MSNNLEHFMKSFVHANERKAQLVQTKQVQQMVNSNVVSTSAKTTAKTTTRMSDDEYKKYIIAAAIAHIIKYRETM